MMPKRFPAAVAGMLCVDATGVFAQAPPGAAQDLLGRVAIAPGKTLTIGPWDLVIAEEERP